MITISLILGGILAGFCLKLPRFDVKLEALQKENELLKRDLATERGWSASIQKDAIKNNVYLPRTTRAFSEAQ